MASWLVACVDLQTIKIDVGRIFDVALAGGTGIGFVDLRNPVGIVHRENQSAVCRLFEPIDKPFAIQPLVFGHSYVSRLVVEFLYSNPGYRGQVFGVTT